MKKIWRSRLSIALKTHLPYLTKSKRDSGSVCRTHKRRKTGSGLMEAELTTQTGKGKKSQMSPSLNNTLTIQNRRIGQMLKPLAFKRMDT